MSAGTIISESGLSAMESETHLAVGSNGFVVVAWISIQPNGGSSNGYVFSTDGGTTWGDVANLDSPNGQVASDPVIAVDANNNFTMTWIGFNTNSQGTPTNMTVYSATAPSGTTTFGTPVVVDSGSDFDKPWILESRDGSLILTYADTGNFSLKAARSTDKGATWATSVVASGNAFRNLAYPCTPTDGTSHRVYVVYTVLTNGANPSGIGIHWSDDDGVTWPDANKAAVAQQNEVLAFEDPTCVAKGDEVWVAYGITSDNAGDPESTVAKLDKVQVAHSTDGGATFTSYTNAADTVATKYALLPAMAIEESGALDVVYYAGAMADDPEGSYRRTRSTDGGATWSSSVVVSNPLTFSQDRASQLWLGDYTGVAASGGSIYHSFADNSSGTSHIRFVKESVQ